MADTTSSADPRPSGALDALKARDIMTREVVSVRPDAPIRQVAQLLIDKGISAVPVIDDSGAAIGMVSEGDLIGRDEMDREARRDWWLELLADPERRAQRLASVEMPQRLARDVMAGPVVTVAEDTDIREIAQVLATYRVKRVPVTGAGRVVGIVSRADLLRALAHERPRPPARHKTGLLAGALSFIDEQFGRHQTDRAAAADQAGEQREPEPLAQEFRGLVADFEHQEAHHREEARRRAAEQRRGRVASLIDHHVSDEYWGSLVHQARQAAEHGEKEFLLLRFPSQLCSDGARAINVTEPGWEATLRGEAAEVYLRWERDLKPHGFHLAARVLDFPGGKPGDVGLFLIWGK